ncbi:MAG TPA: TMEM175 family protein [Candidatus Acidoferrales bacterium]|nr:TMEM175 family protein [Candidatus Acidoferrales bacterium]
MIRQLVGRELVPPEPHFRWRGGEITRLEAFTDAVFAFAVTLLVVSLEVPRTYAELISAMKGFVAFAICFALLAQIWRRHYLFSRRYGLQTQYAITLNSILLFVVLFYVYPLKFLFTMAIGGLTGGVLAVDRRIFDIRESQVTTLVAIYSVGFSAVSAVFALLHRYAYSKRAELELNSYETVRTRSSVVHHAADVGLGVFVALVAKLVPVAIGVYSALLFFLAAPIHSVIGSIYGKRARQALERIESKPPVAASS